MKKTLFLILLPVLFTITLIPQTVEARETWNRERIEQQIEIIKQEISVMRSLLANINSQGPISASSYLVIDLNNNSVILERNSQTQHSIASITKLMSAVVARENINEEETIVLSREMLKPYGYSPAIFLGREISANDLLKASMIQSTNDAAEALAHFRGRDVFISLMNEKAKELEMNNTVFMDSHGLNYGNRSTARDLSKLISYVNKEHPDILTISRYNDFWLEGEDGKMLKFRNMNNFYPLSSFIGGKNGYLPQAGQTSLTLFNIEGKLINITVLGSNNRQRDVFSLINKIKKDI